MVQPHLPSCANFCLKQTACEFGHLYPSMISGAVLHNFYVDKCLVSVSIIKEKVLACNGK